MSRRKLQRDKRSGWMKAAIIFYNAQDRSGEKFEFRVRGLSAAEIAHYLLSEAKAHLNPSEIKFLKSLDV